MELKEAYIRTDKGNIYYTKRGETLISLAKTIFLDKNIPVRVYYDTAKDLYVFGDANNFIHADLANYMKYHSNTYGADEMRANVSYLMKNCALFQILPDDDFKKYDVGDGYKTGWVSFINDMIFACRDKEYFKVRDNVPLFKDHIGDWTCVEYYEYKKSQKLNESVENKITFKPSKEHFVIGGKDFEEEGCDIYRIYDNDKEIGIMALKEYDDGISLDGLEIGEPYRKKGYGKKVVDILKEKYKRIYVRSIPSAKEFWKKQGHKAYWNDDSGTYDGELMNESVEDKILYLVRGLPGSGKSTLAKTLTDNVVEADQFLYDENGDYVWTQERVYKAHKQCQATVKKYMEEGRDKIAVANCFVKLRDMKPYKKLAEEFGYKVIIKVCKGNYGSIHNVSDETMNRMKNNFQLDESNQDNSENYYFIGKCNDTDDGMEIQEITHWDEWGNSEYYGIPEDDESIEVIDTNAFFKMIGNQPRPNKIEYCAKNKDKDIIWAYDDEGIHWFYSQSDNELFESAENDKELRSSAVKLANIIIDSLIRNKYETLITNGPIQINVDKEFKKAVPILKDSPYDYHILLSDKNDDPYPNYGKTDDKKHALITLPIFDGNPSDLLIKLLQKHKRALNKITAGLLGKDYMDAINKFAIKCMRQQLSKWVKSFKTTYMFTLTHECTHLIDDVRRTKTYQNRGQNLRTEKGITAYWNSAEEQNAYYQETMSLFDEWAKDVSYKKFDVFMGDFIRLYKGDWNKLNDINKRKLKKRAYAYWELYMKE